MSLNMVRAKQQIPNQTSRGTLGDEFAELRRIAAEENYELPTLPRSAIGRPNDFAGCGIPVLNPFPV
jgi:hypothetical protein